MRPSIDKPVREIRFLNHKEAKLIYEALERQWEFSQKLDFAFIKNTKNNIYAVHRDIGKVDLRTFKVNSIGMYIAEEQTDTYRFFHRSQHRLRRCCERWKNAIKELLKIFHRPKSSGKSFLHIPYPIPDIM